MYGGSPEERREEVERVRTEVHQHASSRCRAPKRGVGADRPAVHQALAVAEAQVVAQRSGIEKRARLDQAREHAPDQPDGEDAAAVARRFEHVLGVGHARGHRLLAEDVATGSERGGRVLGVAAGRRSHDHEIRRQRSECLVNRPERSRRPEMASQRRRPGGVGINERGDTNDATRLELSERATVETLDDGTTADDGEIEPRMRPHGRKLARSC